MRIEWLGHACFRLTTRDGTRILTDPFNHEVGYPVPAVEAEVVTVSHQHFDHNAVDVVLGRPCVVQEPGEHRIGAITVRGISTFHDREGGAKRGANIVFVIEADGLRVCHLGDLGHPLNEEQRGRIGPVDVLLIPVGGTFTIDAREAAETVTALKPRIAVPMHYKTRYMNFPIAGVEEFTRYCDQVTERDRLDVRKDALPAATEVVVLSFVGERKSS